MFNIKQTPKVSEHCKLRCIFVINNFCLVTFFSHGSLLCKITKEQNKYLGIFTAIFIMNQFGEIEIIIFKLSISNIGYYYK